MWFLLELQNLADVYRLFMGLFAHKNYLKKVLKAIIKNVQTWKYYGILTVEQLFLNTVQLSYSNVDH